MKLGWIAADWPVSAHVHAGTTTRESGHSQGPYRGLNLGDHVGDDAAAVTANRRALVEALALPHEPLWLHQVHGAGVIDAAIGQVGAEADASYTRRSHVVCVVLTADCLPVLLCDERGTEVAAIHAGWRGLAAGVIERTVAALVTPAEYLMAWLGPAIGPTEFEVGDEVRAAFVGANQAAASAFVPSSGGRWLADIYTLARLRLHGIGITAVYGGDRCTVTEREHFYSYRRDGTTGRMANLIWFGD